MDMGENMNELLMESFMTGNIQMKLIWQTC